MVTEWDYATWVQALRRWVSVVVLAEHEWKESEQVLESPEWELVQAFARPVLLALVVAGARGWVVVVSVVASVLALALVVVCPVVGEVSSLRPDHTDLAKSILHRSW